MPASSNSPEGIGGSRHRWRVAEALALLLLARLLVALVPFRWWRNSLGEIVSAPDALSGGLAVPAQALGAVVTAHRRAVQRLPIEVKCLPQAMTMQWMLRCRGLPSVLTFAALPKAGRGKLDDLHAWVSAAGEILVGESSLPYVPLLHLG